jgi:ATP-dependent 26S proteasome regulatory subunit
LVRRFDEIIEYGLPDADHVHAMIKRKLGMLASRAINWQSILPLTEGLSQAELARVADEAVKEAILSGKKKVSTSELSSALAARRVMREAVADIFVD